MQIWQVRLIPSVSVRSSVAISSRYSMRSLIAIIVCTVAAIVLKNYGVEVATIGSVYPELAGGVALPKPEQNSVEAHRELRMSVFRKKQKSFQAI